MYLLLPATAGTVPPALAEGAPRWAGLISNGLVVVAIGAGAGRSMAKGWKVSLGGAGGLIYSSVSPSETILGEEISSSGVEMLSSVSLSSIALVMVWLKSSSDVIIRFAS